MEPLTPERLDELLEGVRATRALVVGDVMLDRYVQGVVDRISPEAPVPVVRVEREWSGVGGAGNVALTLAALGARSTLVACVGDDDAGRWLRQAAIEGGIEVDRLLCLPSRPTSVKTRVLAGHQQVVRVDRELAVPLPDDAAAQLAEAVRCEARSCDVLVVQDYDKGVMAPAVVRAALDAAGAEGIASVVDPKSLSFFAYRGATVFKPNARELGAALGEEARPDDPGWMAATRDRLGCVNLLLTLGPAGMVLQTADEEHIRVPAVAHDVYDVSGAGDTVTAAAAAAVAAGASPREAAILATHAAAVGVSRPGVAIVAAADVRDHARAHADVRS